LFARLDVSRAASRFPRDELKIDFLKIALEWRWSAKEAYMLWTIFVILLVLWLLGLVSSYTLGGYIHILLIVALVVLVLNLVSGRRTAL
jgi:hypothetical protein